METVPQGLDQDSDEQPFAEPEELRGLIALGRERGYLTFEQIAATLEEVEVTKEQVSGLHAHLVEHGVEVIAEDGVSAYKEQRAEAANGQREESRARPDGRTEPRLAAPLPALDRQGRPADRRPGGRTGEADRARRHARQAADGRGQPAPRRLDRERLSGPRAELPRPDPGGLAGPDPRGREVRLPPRLQVLHLRDLVDPPGGDAGDRRQGADDPHPGPHGREAEPGRPRRAPAGAALGREPEPAEIADELRWPLADVRDILRVAQLPVSLEKPVGDEDESELGDFVADDAVAEPFEEASEHLQKEGVRKALDALPERERQVIELRYGLSGLEPLTLEEVGRTFGVTRERIRQIENNTLKKLQRLPEAQMLRDAS